MPTQKALAPAYVLGEYELSGVPLNHVGVAIVGVAVGVAVGAGVVVLQVNEVWPAYGMTFPHDAAADEPVPE